MALILHLETATKNCSVSIAHDGKCLALVEERTEDYNHAEKLHRFIQYALEGAATGLLELDAVCVSKGPGSYTGLRIGVSAAKGLCYGLNIPLLAIDTLTVMTQAISVEADLMIPMIDARREEVYSATFDRHKKILSPISAKILDKNSFQEYSGKKALLFGDGAEKAQNILDVNFEYLYDLYPSAEGMKTLAEELFRKKYFEDCAYFEPFYLKDFSSSPPQSSPHYQ
ncbi:MAG: tRNA (adenosine(37)-N6)-threonylcarbamoyltransferase complex dimerization subunit type 1 TsaB [Flavobacteriales bacterium Tduv]